MSDTVLVMMLYFLFKLADANSPIEEFNFNGNAILSLDGVAEVDSKGLFRLTKDSSRELAHVFFNLPFQFKNSSTGGEASSFSTTFVFAMVPEYPKLGGHGIAFAICPSKNIVGFPGQYLGLFNDTNMGNSSNHIVAIELDGVQDFAFEDINDNHVGIDINSLISNASAPASYYDDESGTWQNLTLKSGDPMQVWVEYGGREKQLNVTIHPITKTKPSVPLLSTKLDLSPFINDYMYVGFSSSTGLLSSSHYILGWSFKMNGEPARLDLSRLPMIPAEHGKEGVKSLKVILAVTLSVATLALILFIALTTYIVSRKKKFMEILEDWEVQYGPHRFNYKDLFAATKGFNEKELLGSGGFGCVYRGILPSSSMQMIAVKRISHDSRQGMREFVAEIATIGRLRHPNLVRLLGYCRRKCELFLVYDYMPNGSLEKFLYHKPDCRLSWIQRLQIIKDVASALSYLHRQWLQVVIHRDVKPANVLVDNNMNAVLGDFGLAKFCDHGIEPPTSHIAGTFGYIAPELARTGKANTSTDMYAFGIFMLEIVCGRRPVDPRARQPNDIFLVDWVLHRWDTGKLSDSVDPKLENRFAVQEVELVLKLGLLCSHPLAAARPTISSVVQYLDGLAQLPDHLTATSIQARDIVLDSCDQSSIEPNAISTHIYSVPPFTLTESFASHGR